MNLIGFFISCAYLLNFIAALALLYSKRNNTSTVIAWLMVLIFLPFLGFILYFFFGSTHKVTLYSNRFNLGVIEDIHFKIAAKVIGNEEITTEYRDMFNLTSRYNGPSYTTKNNLKYYDNATDKFDDLLKDIENAKKSINVEYFIIEDGNDITNRLLEALCRKAEEGVEVKLIYDRFGFIHTRRKTFKSLIDKGGEVYAFLPSFIRTVVQANNRDHRKIVVIDDYIAYTGGINVGDAYMSINTKLAPWRDSAVRIEGEAAFVLQMRFLSDFYYLKSQTTNKNEVIKYLESSDYLDTFNPKVCTDDLHIQIIASNPYTEYSDIKDAYFKLITNAKKSICIHSPYFVPDQTIIDALRVAAKSGVEVKLIIPGKPDNKLAYNVALSNIEFMLENGVRIYKAAGFIHSKMFIIDDKMVSIGTANLDIRSFNLNYEVNAFVYDSETVSICQKAFDKDLETSLEFDLVTFRKRGIIQKTKEAISKMIAPLV